MKNRKEMLIRIYKDPKMFWSEWIGFALQIFFIGGLAFNSLQYVSQIEDTSLKAITAIVFAFVLIKLMSWIKLPTEYCTEQIIEDLKEKKR